MRIAACLVSSWLVASSAGAADLTAVFLAPENQRARVSQAMSALRAQVSDLPVAIERVWTGPVNPKLTSQVRRAQKLATKTGATVVVWYDLERCDQVFLYLPATDGGRILVRRIDPGPPAANLETLAIVVRSAIKAVLAGEVVGDEVTQSDEGEAVEGEVAEREGETPGSDLAAEMLKAAQELEKATEQDEPKEEEPDEEEEPAPAVQVHSPRSGRVWRLDAGYAASSLDGSPYLEHGLRVGGGVEITDWLALTLSVRAFLPRHGSSPVADVDLWRTGPTLGAVASWEVGFARLGLSAAAAVDLLMRNLDLEDGASAGEDSLNVQWSLLPAVWAAFPASDSLWVWLEAGAEVHVRQVRVQSQSGTDTYTMIDTPRARMSVSVGVSWRFLR